MSLDRIMSELRTIVEQLERGEIPLEEALLRYEQGVRLCREGQALLKEAEARVEVLTQDGKKIQLPPQDSGRRKG